MQQITACGDLVGHPAWFVPVVTCTLDRVLNLSMMQVANEGKRITIKVGLTDPAHKEAHSHTAATNCHYHSLSLLLLLEKMNVSICLA